MNAFFVGHFPEEPIMPGVLQIEALAQVGGMLVAQFCSRSGKLSFVFYAD